MFRAAVALSALGLVLASALCVKAQEQTEIRTWLGHKSCAVYRVSLPEGTARFQLVPSEAPTTYTYRCVWVHVSASRCTTTIRRDRLNATCTRHTLQKCFLVIHFMPAQCCSGEPAAKPACPVLCAARICVPCRPQRAHDANAGYLC